MAKTGFTTPKLFDYNGNLKKHWYVGFRFTDPVTGMRKPFQFRMDINSFDTVSERRDEGKAVAIILHNALKDDWNPNQEQIKDYLIRKSQETEDPLYIDYSKMLFPVAMDFALGKKKEAIEHKTYKCYSSAKDIIIASATKLGMDRMQIGDVKRKHIKLLLDQVAKDRQAEYDKRASNKLKCRKFTGNNYNKYKRYLSTLFFELFEYDAIEYNPCEKIARRIEIKTNMHRHATEEEENLIKAHLKERHPRFFIYLAIESLCGIRPKEILGLKIEDIDDRNQCFVVHATDGRSKTKESRMVPIPNTLLKYINKLELQDAKPDMYIFSTDFAPGYKRMHRERATELWRWLVKEELGINVTLYSFKGLGGEKKRSAGIDTAAVQSQFGHRDIKTTRIYLHGEEERIRKTIIENTPEF